MRMSVLSLITAMVLFQQPLGADAQTRSPTGRHKPPPKVVQPVDGESSEAPPAPGWFAGFTGGAVAGSDLFAASVVDGDEETWLSMEPFESNGFKTTLDTAFEIGLFAGRRLGDRFSLRADFTWADMGVSAEAATGQVGNTYLYDSFYVLTIGIGAEYRLVRTASHPYLGVELAVVRLDPGVAAGLAQTNLGARLGLGYEKVIDRNWSLRIEGRVCRSGFSVGSWVPLVARAAQPEIDVEGESSMTTWSLVLGAQIEI